MDKKIRAQEQGRLRAKRHRTLRKLRDDLSNNKQNVDCNESGVMEAYKLSDDSEGIIIVIIKIILIIKANYVTSTYNSLVQEGVIGPLVLSLKCKIIYFLTSIRFS